jgi:hypothetical protein
MRAWSPQRSRCESAGNRNGNFRSTGFTRRLIHLPEFVTELSVFAVARLARHGSEVRHIAGDPFDEVLVGPSSAAWGRSPGDHGRVAYVTTDGGTTAPPEGIIRKAALLRVELQPHATTSTPATAPVTSHMNENS